MKNISSKKIGILLSYLTMFASIAIHLVYTPYFIKTIGQDLYGINSFVASIVSWFSLLSFGLSGAYIKYATDKQKAEGEKGVAVVNGTYLNIFLLIGFLVVAIGVLLLFLFVIGAIPLTNYSLFQKRIVFILLVISTVQTAVSFITNLFTLFLTFKERFVWINLISLIGTITTPILSIIALLLNFNIIGVAVANLIVVSATIFVHFLYSFKSAKMKIFRVNIFKEKLLFRSILGFSVFVFVSDLSAQLNNNADQIILGLLATASSVALYQLGATFIGYLNIMTNSIATVFAPQIYRLESINDSDSVNETFLKVSHFQMMLAFLVIGGFLSCGNHFITLWLGSGYEAVFYICSSIFIMRIVPCTESSGSFVLMAKRKHKFRAIAYLALSISNIIISISLVVLLPKDLAIVGCLVGTFISFFIGSWIIINIYYKKAAKLPVGKYYIQLIKFFVMTFFCIAFSFGIERGLPNVVASSVLFRFLIKGVVFTITYLLSLVVFDKQFVLMILKRKR